MDIIIGLPCSEDNSAILVVVDHLFKYAHFIALPTQFTSLSVAAVFSKEIV